MKVASPVYAMRDLHLQNSSTISEFIGNAAGTPNKVAVGGNIYERAEREQGRACATAPPTPANELGEMYVQGQCSTKATPRHALTPCAWGSTDQIWGARHGNVIPPDFLDYIPTLTCCSPYPDNALAGAARGRRSNMGQAYETADLGPRAPCQTGCCRSFPEFDGAGRPT